MVTATVNETSESPLLPDAATSETTTLLIQEDPAPQDTFNFAYIIYFTLGAGYLLPWNAFITAVDYFDYLYPDVNVDRIFSVAYMVVGFFTLLIIVLFYAHRSNAKLRINVGLGMFVVALLIVPVMDLFYIKGESGRYDGFYVTVGAVALCGFADALVQGGLIGSAGELPKRYMQAIVAGTAASGVLVSFLRIFTKAVFPQDTSGTRKSANLYFLVGIILMAICIFFYNIAHKLPVIRYYNDLTQQAVTEEKQEKGGGSAWRSSLWNIIGTIKWYLFGLALIYVVTLSIFPGYITEDVHSELLKDWYSVLLITCYNVFDLVGKSLTALYLIENEKVAIGATVGRLLFYPLFLVCLHGPQWFRTEIPVSLLTCLLGLTNGYFTSVLMMFAPKKVPIQHAETAGIVIVLAVVVGLASGSIVAWFWVI